LFASHHHYFSKTLATQIAKNLSDEAPLVNKDQFSPGEAHTPDLGQKKHDKDSRSLKHLLEHEDKKRYKFYSKVKYESRHWMLGSILKLLGRKN
jgi:hypothetical protein